MAVTVGNGVMAGPFTPNGVTTSFAFEFRVLKKEELSVYRCAPDAWTEVSASLYDVAIDAVEGGEVQFVLPPAAGDPLYIAATPLFDQGTGYAGGEAPFTPKSLNAEFDRAAMRAAVLKERVDRAIVVPRGEEPLPAELPGEGEVWGNVGGKMTGVPNGAAEFLAEAAAAKAYIAGKVAETETAADDAATFASNAASHAGTAGTYRNDAVQAAIDTAGALAVAQALMISGNAFKKPALAAAITQGIGAVADGAVFAATGDDVTYWALYRRAGSGSGELWKMPKALLSSVVMPTLTVSRTLVSGDVVSGPSGPVPVQVNLGLPAGMYGTASVPSNSVNPLPIGTIIPFIQLGTNPLRFAGDGVDTVTITPASTGFNTLLNPGARAWLLKRGINDWLLFGELSQLPATAYSQKIFIDIAALDTLRQERTGAAATTPVAVGDPVGSVRNLGTLGGWATARADDRRPILRQDATGRYYLETDGTNDFLELLGLPLDLAKLNLFVAWKSLSYKSGSGGIVALAPLGLSGGGGYNTAWTFTQNASVYPVPADFLIAMGSSGPTKLQIGPQSIHPSRPHVIEWRSTSNAAAKTFTIDGKLIQSTGPDALPQLATVTALEAATVRMVIGANNGDDGAQEGAIQFSHTAIYGIAGGDEILSTEQRAAIRQFMEDLAYPRPHVMPDISDLTELEAARDALIDEIIGGPLPTALPTVAIDASPPPMGGLAPYLAKVEKVTVPDLPSNVRPRIWTPPSERTDVVYIFMPGHGAGIVENSGEIYGIRPLVQAGAVVASVYLPRGLTDYNAGGTTEHNVQRPPYSEWVLPVVYTINLLLNRYPGAKVVLFGISGGGWTSQLCAAVDARIDTVVQFVGSLPADYYFGSDWEQFYTEISVDYLTTYLLGAAGGSGGRRHIHMMHNRDAVGFNEYTYAARPPFHEELADQAASLGGYYAMEWRDEAFHNLWPSSSAILLAELPAP